MRFGKSIDRVRLYCIDNNRICFFMFFICFTLAIFRINPNKFDLECNTQLLGIATIGNVYSVYSRTHCTFVQIRAYLSMSIAYVSTYGAGDDEEYKKRNKKRICRISYHRQRHQHQLWIVKSPQKSSNNNKMALQPNTTATAIATATTNPWSLFCSFFILFALLFCVLSKGCNEENTPDWLM